MMQELCTHFAQPAGLIKPHPPKGPPQGQGGRASGPPQKASVVMMMMIIMMMMMADHTKAHVSLIQCGRIVNLILFKKIRVVDTMRQNL